LKSLGSKYNLEKVWGSKYNFEKVVGSKYEFEMHDGILANIGKACYWTHFFLYENIFKSLFTQAFILWQQCI